jgi:hypothetical protein
MPELKSAVWEETEAISTETRITKVVKNFVHLHQVHNHHHTERKQNSET